MSERQNTTYSKETDLTNVIKKPEELDAKSWKLIEKMLLTQIRYNRWAGLGRWLFRSAALIFIILMAFGVPQRFHPGFENSQLTKPHIAEIKIAGIIAEEATANAQSINHSLEQAFENPEAKAVILNISSPGGSPTQSDLIWQKIGKLKGEYNKPIFAVIGDIGASGAYYTAVAADKIYANTNSIIGSIGVINESFGFNKLISQLGVERRVITSGEHKAMLDAFSPRSEFAQQHMAQIVHQIHQRFKHVVLLGRQSTLDKDNLDTIFSGLVWVGPDALKLGLIDDIKSVEEVAKNFDPDLEIRDYSQRISPLARLTRKFGQVVAESFASMQGSQPKLF